LEVDLFDDDLVAPIIATLREEELSEERVGWITAWETDPGSVDTENYLKLIAMRLVKVDLHSASHRA